MTRTLLLIALGLSTLLTQTPERPLSDVMAAAGAFVSKWEHEMTGLVAEERYTQTSSSDSMSGGEPSFVRLRSDLSLLPDPQIGWMTFRDVYEVNERPVRDRDARLVSLFMKPNPETLVQAKLVAEESARFNLRVVVGRRELKRSINTPMMVIRYIRPQNQTRSEFKSEGVKTIGGVKALQVKFTEQGMPRLIKSENDAPASGRIWVDLATGRILKGDLGFESKLPQEVTVKASVNVEFGLAPKPDIWVPLFMEETCALTVYGITVTSVGKATYANFRQFSVNVSDFIKKNGGR